MKSLEKRVEEKMVPLERKMDEMIKLLTNISATLESIEKSLKKG